MTRAEAKKVLEVLNTRDRDWATPAKYVKSMALMADAIGGMNSEDPYYEHAVQMALIAGVFIREVRRIAGRRAPL